MNRNDYTKVFNAMVFGVAALAAAPLYGCNDEPENEIEDLSGVPSFAVQRADYMSGSAVALIDGDGELLDDSYISSGKATPGLNAALHGDISLPSTPCKADVLAVVARFGGDYVFEMDLEENEVMHQVPTQNSDLEDMAAYRSNPYDMLCQPDNVALVARFAPNLDAEADELDKGDDIAVIDMAEEEIVDRIDLSEVRTMVQGQNRMGEDVEEEAYARPSSLVPIGEGFAVVGLGRLSSSFIGAPGMVGLVDLEKRELASTFELEGLKNCGTVRQVSGSSDSVLVECSGSPFGDAATAGIVLLELDNGELHEDLALRDQEAPALHSGVVSLGGSRVVAVAPGDWGEMTDDEAFVFDLESGDRESLFASEGPGSIGSGAYRADTGLLLIPDAKRGVRVFHEKDGELEAQEDIEIDQALPARTVRLIRP